MTTYYRGPTALITHDVFVVRGPRSQTFRLDELDGVYVATEGGLLRPRIFELRAHHRGVEVLLFSCSDPRIFGQVRRGLVRALEGRRDRMEQGGLSGYR
ncbi:hypothetical protein HC031_04470 [Planosporangium thailandense]|uniref:Uncharacterized protein n=1 Tax=Planosporangium thailandense TaxID=765197 RepID=A0ABX0XSK8_9ACTN|nr:DUF6232 family protein [Planosporangium thailandense]NJC68985.1 hypothetical protein [Planosporangium thailandense]